VTDTPAVEVTGLSKAYRYGLFAKPSHPVLKDLSFVIPRGEVFGCLGPNGSGKTTLIKILMGLIFPDAGRAFVLGRAISELGWRRQCGYLPEHPYFYDYLTPSEYLEYAGRLLGMPLPSRRDNARRLMQLVKLQAYSNVALRRFSKGMLQRMGIAQSLINDPQVVFLDEPMSGLDLIGRRLVRDIILGLKKAGKTVFLTTHILSDAEVLCDRVGLLRAGKLLREGRLDEILGSAAASLEILATGLDGKSMPAGIVADPVGERWRLEVPEERLEEALKALLDAKGRILSVQPLRQSLEDLFLQEMNVREKGTWNLED